MTGIIIGQILGIIATIITFVSYQVNSKSKLLITQTAATLFTCVSYLFLGAASGFALNIVCIVRNVIFYFVDSRSKWNYISASALALCMVVLGAMSWQGPISLLVIIALAVNTVIMSLGKPQLLRQSVLLTSSMILVYNIFVFSLGGIVNEGVAIVSSAIGIVRFVAGKKTRDDKFLRQIDLERQKRIDEIRGAADAITVRGTVYYVSAEGDDSNDGKTELTPWKTLSKVSEATLFEGDAVLFRRGDVFRGFVKAQSGVTYAAYSEGEKPRLYGWDKSLADVNLWTLFDPEHHIWKLTEPILDCGTLVFDGGKAHCRKLIPSYINSKFVCREDESRLFVMAREMTNDLDMVCFYDERTTDKPSKGENFPVPVLDSNSLGQLYLRCDGGNPAHVFSQIEALPRRSMIQVGSCKNVTVDNLCLKYIGIHAVAGGGYVSGLHVSNCVIGWVGGTGQHYFGTDPNYPQGRRGSVTRFGNGVEIYGGCDDYTVKNCYIYQVYDAGITHQVTTRGQKYTMTNIRYLDNVVENCVYSIEYFLEKTEGDTESYIDGCEIGGNILHGSGCGWGQQRHNVDTPAHIKGWSYENTAKNFVIHHNIFDRAAYRMLHTVAKTQESCPQMYENTYIQKTGQMLGQYGSNEICEPLNMIFDSLAEQNIARVIGDKNASVHHIK